MKSAGIALVVLTGGTVVAVDRAWAQEPPVVRLTLPEAVSRGLAASYRVSELDARGQAARAIEDQRKAADLPQVALRASYTRTNHVQEFTVPNALGGIRVIYPDIPDNYRSR